MVAIWTLTLACYVALSKSLSLSGLLSPILLPEPLRGTERLEPLLVFEGFWIRLKAKIKMCQNRGSENGGYLTLFASKNEHYEQRYRDCMSDLIWI